MVNFNKKYIIYYLGLVALFFVVFNAGIYIGKSQVICRICTPENVDFSLFWDAYNTLHESFIEPGKIDDQKIIYGAISGMVKSLGDPYTDLFDPEHAKLFEQDLSGSFEGIGVEIGTKKEQLTVISPLKGTPGERAGLKAGDLILKINGESTADMSIDQAVSIIRGKKGTEVTLNVYREDWDLPRDIVIVRDTIKVESIHWELKNNEIAYIQVYQFDRALPSDFKKVALEILSSPARKIILDLRNNPGGYLEVSQDIAGWFLENDQVIIIEDFGEGKEKEEYKAKGPSSFNDYPIVVLINNGSAPASEILAGALRDNRNIQLIGEKSFGKGSVQEVIELRDEKSFLKVTVAKWLTPKGSLIAEVGLTPDIKVELKESDIDQNKDPQLEKALEIINGLQ